MPEIEIRIARENEVEKLIPLYEWLFAPPGSVPSQWDPKRAAVALSQAIESHDACVLVAVEVDDGLQARERPAARPARSQGVGEASGRESEDELVGICTAYLDMHSVRFGYRAWVEDLAVDPDRRSQGIGGRLLEAAKDWARERGATHLELDSAESRLAAHRFYERARPSWRSISYAWEL
jgi:GNAT superfamily N-acetyltransferase